MEAAAKELAKIPDSAHDMSHVMRVYKLALVIAKAEKEIDPSVLQAATLLHDIGGYKEMSDPSGKTDHAVISAAMAVPILKKLDFSNEKIKHIQDCIISHRYKTNNQPKTLEAKILFDADKLDSIGAIGVARAFIWVGKNNANIYRKVNIDKYVKSNMSNGRVKDKTKHSPQIEFAIKQKHFLDKLYTTKGKEICKQRLKYYKDYLNRLEQEVNGKL